MAKTFTCSLTGNYYNDDCILRRGNPVLINKWSLNELDNQLLEIALNEDLGQPRYDATTTLLFADMTQDARGVIINKDTHPIVLAGKVVVDAILSRFCTDFVIHSDYEDGDVVPGNERILSIETSAQQLLMLERTLLNYLRHLSGIATLTRDYVLAAAGKVTILDTRKTLPGMRHLEKYAVYCGGGVNHRMGLYDAIMIKDTHIDIFGGIDKVLAALPSLEQHTLPVIIEIGSSDELTHVLQAGVGKVTRILLDNMNVDMLKQCVTLCAGQFETEASGNMTLEKIPAIAKTGVDFVSVGCITHSAGNVDLSMKTEIL